ncbi:hypothetical protein [Roseiconus lacunae]|uniref:hypothetical protein n=1 Tax=Roseiconus lacunae TaxID=2605694 RepID=UPI001E317E09|nr:hypothetical protein [Roseiconus lacunae]
MIPSGSGSQRHYFDASKEEPLDVGAIGRLIEALQESNVLYISRASDGKTLQLTHERPSQPNDGFTGTVVLGADSPLPL